MHEGDSSALPVPNFEKWSHNGIVSRSASPPIGMEKLKMAGVLEGNPEVVEKYFYEAYGNSH
ncbi:MAG: hypothetical protein V7K85_12150 [Nostoc sp.]